MNDFRKIDLNLDCEKLDYAFKPVGYTLKISTSIGELRQALERSLDKEDLRSLIENLCECDNDYR